MKNIIIATCLFLLTSNAFACMNKAPISAVMAYMTSSTPMPGVTCEQRPEDECLCFDDIKGWDVAKIVEVEETSEMPNGESNTRTVVKIINDSEKLAARTIRLAAEKLAKEEMDTELANDQKCLRAKARLRVNNKKKGLTKQQKAAFLNNPEAKKVMDALNVCSIDEAKSLIQAWSADGVITTEQDKLDMVKELE